MSSLLDLNTHFFPRQVQMDWEDAGLGKMTVVHPNLVLFLIFVKFHTLFYILIHMHIYAK